MKKKIGYLTILFACSMMVLFESGFFALEAQQRPTISVNKGAVQVFEKSLALSSLTIAEGASLAGPEGKALTMTVDGIGKAIKPGVYKGDIFITVTDKFIAPPSGLPFNMGRGMEPQEFRTAILIEDGKYVPEKSVPAMVQGGKVTDKAATGVTIMGSDDDFNGIVITGKSEYTIEDVKIDFEGNGSNDFIGIGAGIAIFDNSKVTINNSEIKLHGVIRSAIHFGGHSVTTLNNCRLINESPDTEEVIPLWSLGLRGTNRGTQHCDYATVYYNNCYVQGNGWGSLAIDGGVVIRIYVKDSTVNLTGPRARGYGAFSIGNALISYDNSTVNVQGFSILMHDEDGKSDGEITNGSVINATPYGVMIFRDGGSELRVNKGATINSSSSTFVVKGSHSYLNIDKAVLNPGNGVILQLMDNDEPSGSSRFIVPIGADVPIPGRNMTVADPKEDVFMTVSNMEVKGDFYNSTTNLKANCIESAARSGVSAEGGRDASARQGVKNLDLKFAKAKVNGVISAATAAYKEGVVIIDISNCEELSAVTQTAHEPVNNGVIVSFDKDSVWTVAGTSYLTSITVAKGAVIKAPEGKTLTMTVDGVKTPIGAGTYKGKIVITFSKS
jgi:hypothetical protein